MDNFTKWLLGAMAAAFTAWSGVIWTSVQRVGDLYSDIQLVKATVTRTQHDLVEISEDLKGHQMLPWHREAGMRYQRSDEELKRLDARIIELERDGRVINGR